MRYKLLIIWLSFKWIFRVNLGDEVYYKNNKHIVRNGVRCNSWRLSELDNGDDGWVKRADCKKVWTFDNILNSYKHGYNFYITNWYNIWKTEGIKDWMRQLQIW